MGKKKNKKRDKIRAKIKNRKQQEKLELKETIRYRCLKCGIEEEIPRGVVETFDIMDDGDISVPPRFDCEECDGQMEPVEYFGVHGINYEIKDK